MSDDPLYDKLEAMAHAEWYRLGLDAIKNEEGSNLVWSWFVDYHMSPMHERIYMKEVLAYKKMMLDFLENVKKRRDEDVK